MKCRQLTQKQQQKNYKDSINTAKILKSTKIYVNESLCPQYPKLLRKCNSLLKKNQLKSFYTLNSKLKIKYDSDSDEVSAVATHDKNLLEIFGYEMMTRVKSEHNPRR